MSSKGVPGSPDDAMATLDSIDAAFDRLSRTPFWQMSCDHVAEFIRRMHRIENRSAAMLVRALGEGTARGLPVDDGCKSTGAWLRGLVPVTPSAANTRALLAVELPRPEMAPTREAFSDGSMSVQHAGVVMRTTSALEDVPEVDATTRAEAQGLLVDESERLDPVQLGRVGTKLRQRLCPDGPERLAADEDAQQAARSAYLVQESTGMWLLRASLPAAEGAMLRAALDPLAVPRAAADGGVDARTGMQRNADALVALAELSLAQGAGSAFGLPTRHGSAVRLVVTADLETVLADLTSTGRLAGLAPATVQTGEPGGWDLSPLTAQALACDAEIVPMLLDRFGRPLDVGDSMYRFPARIRKAIELRDGHCTYPNCQAPTHWCHTHHLVPFGRNGKPGGPTAEANGTLLCGPHHRFVHASGWTGTLLDGRVRWHPPPPGEPPPPNTAARDINEAIRHLVRRWLARNPELRDIS